MILFDVLSDILFFKKGDQLQSIESEAEVSPFMLNRWISMHSTKSATLVNATSNRYWSVLSNKLDWYRFSLTLFPRNRYTKIEYIKKATKESSKEKTERNEEEKIYQILARNLELSVREVKSYVEDGSIDLTPLRKILKNDKRT